MSASHQQVRMTIEEVYEYGLTAGYDLRTSWTYGWRKWPVLSDRLQKAFRDGWLDGRDYGLRDKRPSPRNEVSGGKA